MKNKIAIATLVTTILLTGGCGSDKYIKDDENKIITYSETGQNLQNNILCKPNVDSKLYELYEQYDDNLKVSLKKLPNCDEFKITSNKSSGIWEFIFVKPIAYLILKLGKLVGNMGISLIIVGILIRLILLPFSYKTHKQSMGMQKIQSEMQKIENKYRGKEDKESMMLKSQEMMALYKKNNVKPFGGCLVAFLQLPIFFAFLEAINRVPAIFEDSLFGLNLGMTPYVGLTNGNYVYIILIALIALSTYFSFKYSMKQTSTTNVGNDTQNQMKTMLNVMTIMIVITSFSLSTALSLYWIATYAFIAIQTYFFRKMSSSGVKKQHKKNIFPKNNQVNKKNNIKDKLDVKKGLKYGNN